MDHLHLAVPDQPKAVAWYQKHFGGQPTKEGEERLMFGEVRVIFQKNEKPTPSNGSVLDHIGLTPEQLQSRVVTAMRRSTYPVPRLGAAAGTAANFALYLAGGGR